MLQNNTVSVDLKRGYYLFHVYHRIAIDLPNDRAILTLWETVNRDQRIMWAYMANQYDELCKIKTS